MTLILRQSLILSATATPAERLASLPPEEAIKSVTGCHFLDVDNQKTYGKARKSSNNAGKLAERLLVAQQILVFVAYCGILYVAIG